MLIEENHSNFDIQLLTAWSGGGDINNRPEFARRALLELRRLGDLRRSASCIIKNLPTMAGL